jgi:hypothetical protein
MRDCRASIFLTLVVASFAIFTPTFSWAAPNDNVIPNVVKEPIQDVNDPSLAESAAQNGKEDQILQFTFGFLAGQVTKKLNNDSQTISGFTYDQRDIDQNYWSISANWLSSKAAWVEAGKKFMFWQENLYESYYKLSISHFADPDDALAGLTRIDSFKASASIGLLDLWTLGRIVNVEFGLHVGSPGIAYHAQAGLQWSF